MFRNKLIYGLGYTNIWTFCHKLVVTEVWLHYFLCLDGHLKLRCGCDLPLAHWWAAYGPVWVPRSTLSLLVFALILKCVAVMIRVDVISMTRMGLWTWIILYFAQNNRFTLSSGHEWMGTGPHLPHHSLTLSTPCPIRLVEVCRLFSLLTKLRARMCVCVPLPRRYA